MAAYGDSVLCGLIYKMKPRFISKVFCPERRTKTESNEE